MDERQYLSRYGKRQLRLLPVGCRLQLRLLRQSRLQQEQDRLQHMADERRDERYAHERRLRDLAAERSKAARLAREQSEREQQQQQQRERERKRRQQRERELAEAEVATAAEQQRLEQHHKKKCPKGCGALFHRRPVDQFAIGTLPMWQYDAASLECMVCLRSPGDKVGTECPAMAHVFASVVLRV